MRPLSLITLTITSIYLYRGGVTDSLRVTVTVAIIVGAFVLMRHEAITSRQGYSALGWLNAAYLFAGTLSLINGRATGTSLALLALHVFLWRWLKVHSGRAISRWYRSDAHGNPIEASRPADPSTVFVPPPPRKAGRSLNRRAGAALWTAAFLPAVIFGRPD